MRKIRYSVAVSLDGFIAGPKGEADWIIMDPDIDFKSIIGQFDTAFVGRRTYTSMTSKGDKLFGMKTFVFSKTLQQDDYPGVTIVPEISPQRMEALRQEEGKDIWLFGGGLLFRSLLDAGLVDTVEVAVIPVLLGKGIPLLPGSAQEAKLKLTGHKIYPKTGTIGLDYAIEKS